MNFELDQGRVDELLTDFEIDHASESQRSIIAEFVTILHEFTEIPSKTLMGFVYIAILSWENENKGHLMMLEKYSPEEREAALDILIDSLKFMLRGVLVKPGQWDKLEEGIDMAYNRYRAKWKNR